MKSGQRSRGAVALARTGKTSADIAARVGVSDSFVRRIVRGQRTPKPDLRIAFRKEFEIDPSWWDEEPNEETSTSSSAAEITDISVRAQTAELRLQVMQLMQSIREPSAGTTPDERSKVMQRTANTLVSLGRITGETLDMPEERLIRVPAMRRIRDVMIETLKPWPDAMRAVGEMLTRIGHE